MPHRYARQNAGQQPYTDEIGMPKMTDGAESRSQVLRLISTGMGTQNQCTDNNPRGVEDNTDFFSPTPSKQFSRIIRKSEDANPTILSRHQRSQSVGSASASTCYVMHDSEGKPVLHLRTNGFALNKKHGGVAVLREHSQTSGSSSRNVYKDVLPLPNNEEIVLMRGDSSKDGRSVTNSMQLEQDGVNGKGEQFQSDRKTQASGRRRRKKRASKHMYSIENQDSEENLGSCRGRNSRRRRDSKDSCDSFENIQDRRVGNKISDTDINEFQAQLALHRQQNHRHGSRSQTYAMKSEDRRVGNTTSATDINKFHSQLALHRQQNHKHGSRSEAYAMKQEELSEFRRSKNRNARFRHGKDSSAKESLEDTTQEPHSSASNRDFEESEGIEDTASSYEDEEAKDTTASASENPATPKKGGGGGTPTKAEKPKAKGAKGSTSASEASKKGGPTPSSSKTAAGKKSVAAAGSKKSVASAGKKSDAAAAGKKSVAAAGGKDKKKSLKAEGGAKKSTQLGEASKKGGPKPSASKTEAGKDKRKSEGGKDKKKSKVGADAKKSVDAGKRKSSEGGKDKKKSKADAGKRKSSEDKKKKSKSLKGDRSQSIFTSSNESSRRGSRSGSRPASTDASDSALASAKGPSPTTLTPSTDASAILGLQGKEEPPAGDAGKRKKSKKSKSKGDLSEAASEANSSDNQSDGGRKSAASSRSASPKPGKDVKRKDSKAGKEKKDKGKDKPRKASKPGRADKKKGPETKPGDDAGLVQGLAQELPEPEPLPPTVRESVMTNTSGDMYSDETTRPPSAVSAEEAYSWPPPEKEEPPQAEIEFLGTIVYQHVARYICIGLLRVAGGVRVLFDVAEKQGYVQVISPLCEPYVTYYVNNMTFLTSTSAAGVAWAGAVYRKKDSKSGKEAGSEKKGESGEKMKQDKDKFTEEAIKSRLERCNLPEMSKTMIDTAHVVFCDPYQAQRFRTVLETLKSAVECSNCLIMPCIGGNTNMTFPGPPVVPCTIVDPACIQQPCPPPLPPPCCSIPFCPPNRNIQFQQQCCQCIPIGPNPCVGAPSRQQTDLCGGQQQGMIYWPCPDAFVNHLQYSCHGQPTPNQPNYNSATASPLMAQAPGMWSGNATPQASSQQTQQASSYPTQQTSAYPTTYPTQTQYQQPQMLSQNEMISQPSSPITYAQYSDLGGGGVRFNPNVQYKQLSQQGSMVRSDMCANAIPAAQMDCYDPYSYENCCGKTLFCAPACLVRLNSDMAWTDLQKGCLKIYQCPNNGGYSLVLENGEKAITTHHYLTPETMFAPSEKTQFGFTYTTVTRSENRGTIVDHYLVSFMNCRLAEQFKCLVDRIRAMLQSQSEDWCGAPCPSKPQRPTPSIRQW